MWAKLVPIIASLVWSIVKKWIANEAQKEVWNEKIKILTQQYNDGVKQAAELKQMYEDQKKKIDEEWQKRWGQKEVK